MSVRPLGAASALVALIQTSVRAQSKARTQKKSAHNGRPRTETSPEERLLAQIRAIESADEQGSRNKHLRALVDYALGEAFGEPLRSEAAFQSLASEVTRLIDADPALSKTVDEACQSLRALASSTIPPQD